MSLASEQRELVFARDEGECFAAATLLDHHCTGEMQCAHLYPASWTRNHILSVKAAPHRFPDSPLLACTVEEVIYDPDCAVPMCGAHVAWDNLGERCFFDQLPIRFVNWSCQWNLFGRVLDHYPQRPADLIGHGNYEEGEAA